MFIRKKKNGSGSISIQIIDKSAGKYKVLKTIGSSADKNEIEFLYKKAIREIDIISEQPLLPFEATAELEFIDTFINSIEGLSLVGPELLLGAIYNEIGFNKIPEQLFRHLVITRLVYPVSKLKTADYLFKYKGIEISVWSIYRYLDTLDSQQIERIKKISIDHTLEILGEGISIVFYDVTTLYFEASDEDDFRKTGFSKDGKHQNPQIVLGLLVSENGYPLDYCVFEGSQYEGSTLQTVINQFEKKYAPSQLVVVADAGILSKENRNFLNSDKYRYILGGRIKNEAADIKEQILKLDLKDNQSIRLELDRQTRLIVSYKEKRAHKDAHNRKRGLEKLKKKVAAGRLTKQHINNKGYNKYLVIEGEATIKIDETKYEKDKKWDGLKGYITNTDLENDVVIEKYNQLWQIEKAFRISKSDLQIRPIYHRIKERIEAHICIAFVACKIYKELDRQLKIRESPLSPEKAIDVMKTIYQITFQTPYSSNTYKRLIIKNKEQADLVKLFDLKIPD